MRTSSRVAIQLWNQIFNGQQLRRTTHPWVRGSETMEASFKVHVSGTVTLPGSVVTQLKSGRMGWTRRVWLRLKVDNHLIRVEGMWLDPRVEHKSTNKATSAKMLPLLQQGSMAGIKSNLTRVASQRNWCNYRKY